MGGLALYLSSVVLSCVIRLIVSTATLRRIYQNSKSTFAYILVAFTLADSISAAIFLIANIKHSADDP